MHTNKESVQRSCDDRKGCGLCVYIYQLTCAFGGHAAVDRYTQLRRKISSVLPEV